MIAPAVLWALTAAVLFDGAQNALSATRPAPVATAGQPPCTEYYLGWSTGHVGTTTLDSASTYHDSGTRQLSSFAFFFEGQGVQDVQGNVVDADAWPRVVNRSMYDTGMSVADERKYVQEIYLPMLTRGFEQRRKIGEPVVSPSTCVDLSHINLFFIDGLLAELSSSAATLLRIRRPALETAISLCDHVTPHELAYGLSSNLNEYGCPTFLFSAFRYCPLSRGDSGKRVVLTLPDSVWTNFSAFQMALWNVDEVEAQWRRLLATRRSGVSFAQVAWSSDADDFASRAVAPTAALMGLGAQKAPETSKQHTAKMQEHPIEEYQRQAREYEQLMREHSPAFDAAASMLRDAVWNRSGPVLRPQHSGRS